MRILFIFVACLFYTCAAKDDRRQELLIDSDSAVADTSSYDGGLSEFGKGSRKIQYDSILSRNCIYQNVSANFNIEAFFYRYLNTEEDVDSFSVKLILIDKINKMPFDSIELGAHFYYESTFKDCKNVRSYVTKFNIKKEVTDNNYGDIIVADFNFDNKEDIALIRDSGGNAGPLYSFFIQNKVRKFVKDEFLTDSIEFFPSEINRKKKTLTTNVHIGSCERSEKIYFLDINANCWKEESHKIINICK